MMIRTAFLVCLGLLALHTTNVAAAASASAAAIDAGVIIGAPNNASQQCDEADFGAVQIRIGLFATLAACYRDVEMDGKFGTAFVTVPREFEGRTISRSEFDTFRADVKESEDQFRRRSREARTAGESNKSVGSQPIPLGVFDYTSERVGYAYAYAVAEPNDHGGYTSQTMMRTESFVYVNDRVILLMIIAPVDNGSGASVAFDLSEQWAKAIISASSAKVAAKATQLN
ncbi:MAG: hypothetical protein WBD51_15425 [Burkholderiaceae bacterium]